MSKGVILKLNSDMAIILKDDGSFIARPRDMSWRVADIIILPEKKVWKYVLSSCAAVFISLFCLTGIFYNITSTYIEISVNPSIQLTLNRFGRVLNASGLNSDGISIIQGMPFKNLTLNEATAHIYDRLESNGVLNDSTIQLVIANDSQKELDKIEQALREVTDRYAGNYNAHISIQRYAQDEYQALSHPLPVEDKPVSPTGQPTLQPKITSPTGSPTIPASPSPSASSTPTRQARHLP